MSDRIAAANRGGGRTVRADIYAGIEFLERSIAAGRGRGALIDPNKLKARRRRARRARWICH